MKFNVQIVLLLFSTFDSVKGQGGGQMAEVNGRRQPLVVCADHSIASDVYATSDCAGSAPTGVVQDDNPTFT